MAIKDILKVPNDLLETPCEKVGAFDDDLKKLAEDLVETLLAAKNPEGAGLAAPQIGVLKRVIAVRRFFNDPENPEESVSKEYVLVNPKIISESKEKDTRYEACLSIPDSYGQVERPKKIKVKAYDVKGNVIRMSESGFLGRTIQHEIDHLDGILFTTKTNGPILTNDEIEQLYEVEE